MTEPDPNNKTITAAKDEPVCNGCPEADKCRQVWSMPNQGPFTSAGLSLAGILVFLLPIFTAIVAGALVHAFVRPNSKTHRWEIAAAAAGLIAGAFLARLLLPLIKKYFSRPDKSLKN
jgi:hypothetical protein